MGGERWKGMRRMGQVESEAAMMVTTTVVATRRRRRPPSKSSSCSLVRGSGSTTVSDYHQDLKVELKKVQDSGNIAK